ncbi:MAG: hypothetical protein HY903_24525 [Deltaproteobacteria bacterium]|nr:hypothetical protein [Deltaproteobacteria bacterium]
MDAYANAVRSYGVSPGFFVRALLVILSILQGCGGVDFSGARCDAVTEASAATASPCVSTGPHRCAPYVGGPTYDAGGAMLGCDVTWSCPEGELGFRCVTTSAAYRCECRKDQVATGQFSWTGDPCSRARAAEAAAGLECGWKVP